MSISHIFQIYRRKISAFTHDTRGVSAILIALIAIPLFGFVGLSVDLGRAYVLKSKLSTALDAAGLAAGRNIFASDSEIYADAQKYFDANFPSGYMSTTPITLNSSNLKWDSTRETVTLSVHVDLNTTFMNVLGLPSLTVGALAEVNRDNRGMELVLVLDNTGSMNSYTSGARRIETLKTASKNLIDILYGNDEIKKKLWVGIVPYTTQVNVGPQNINFLSNADRDNILNNTTSIFTADGNNTALGRNVNGSGGNDTVYGWKGCVEMRDHLDGGTKDLSDDPPNNDFVPYFYNSTESYSTNYKNDWATNGVSGSRGPNKYCPPPVLPLTAEKSTIKGHIDKMETSGPTAVNIGLIWGWRALSPRWNGQWYGSSTVNLPSGYSALPLQYGEEFMDKVVILMTDGENTLGTYGIYHAYGRQKQFGIKQGEPGYDPHYHTSGSGNLASKSSSYYKSLDDQKTAQACTNMKAAGVIIYSVIFVSGNEGLFENCATSPKHYFKATTADALIDNFNTIGEELSNLRISK
ncbi:pilus assembly protein TadG-related protein [Sneathiella sp.]|jgi:Flp pilus assembly protein TadG|uniref:pilus assembly protein TadG-related protein n=1 Tax=Sneathiella sp. TaxID=1964365 RepID=UPI0039E235C1